MAAATAERVSSHQAVGVRKEQYLARAVECARVPCLRSAGMLFQPDEPAGEFPDYLDGIVLRAVIHDDDLIPGIPGSKDRLKTLPDEGAPFRFRNDDGDWFNHIRLA